MTKEERRKVYAKAYRQAHKDKAKAYMKAWHEANKESEKAAKKSWYEANKEYHLARCKSYEQAHMEQLKEYQKAYKKAYYQSHKEQCKTYARNYMKNDVNSFGESKNSIRFKSSYYLKKHGTKIPGYEIHHCFGYDDPTKFIYCSKSLHLKIHQFLRDNNIDADTDHYDKIKHLLDEKVVTFGL